MHGDIQFKRVYDESGPDDGLRVLCTTLWPRGVQKAAVDRWYRQLGAPRDLIRPYLDGQVGWEEFRQKAWEALQAPEAQQALAELAEVVRQGQRVTLMTSVKEMAKTHLQLVADALREHL